MDGVKMRFFKDTNNKVFAFSEQDDESFFKHLTEISTIEKERLLQPTKAQQAEIDKSITNKAIENLTVTVDTFVFKANDKSITRMLSAIASAEQLGQTETTWKLADGSTATVTLTQLKTAQALAIQAIGALIIS